MTDTTDAAAHASAIRRMIVTMLEQQAEYADMVTLLEIAASMEMWTP